MRISRRGVIGLPLSALAAGKAWGQLVEKDPYDLRTGEYTWHPESSPSGPLAIIVSLPEQLVFVYRNGVEIAASTCSTGKPGHSTPAGVFTILQKDKNHHSSTYDDAPMPNMNRLTWSGIALHAGNLPGYPASHGCVRLPFQFSTLLFGVTHVGTPVIIANKATQPASVTHPGMVLGNYAENEFDTVTGHLAQKTVPAPTHEENKVPPVAVVISAADGQAYLFENGAEVMQAKAVIADPGKPLGTHAFVLEGAHDGSKGMKWQAVAFNHDRIGGDVGDSTDVISRVKAMPDFVAAMQKVMHPGLTLVLTDQPSGPGTRTAGDFVILNQAPT